MCLDREIQGLGLCNTVELIPRFLKCAANPPKTTITHRPSYSLFYHQIIWLDLKNINNMSLALYLLAALINEYVYGITFIM